MSRTSLAGDAVRGALAGAVAVYALGQLGEYLHGRPTAPAGTAVRMPDAASTSMVPHGPQTTGTAVHYGLGSALGAFYAILRARIGLASVGAGIPYGLAMFVAEHEGMGALVGQPPKPKDAPSQDLARGAVAHGFVAFVTEIVLRVLNGYRARG